MPDLTPPTAANRYAPVLWMRHGTSIDGEQRPHAHARPDTPLSDHGRDEALAAADRLRMVNPVLIVSSPLPRARTTAELLAHALAVPLLPALEVLREWQAPDCVLGLGPEQYPPRYTAWKTNRHRRIGTALPGGESLEDLHTRARAARDTADLLADGVTGLGGPVVIVSHQLLIGAVAALTTCAPAGEPTVAAVFAAATRFRLDPASWWVPG
ncbi:histidine phosphatase family protein [Umezawaea sp. Da 62-37]|uniref:histidine phosphatase family protein n=1 Tax=Umezawaea sp. Da 62-37 TaxID=3075927 RepID=UPI0028F73E66|nr:histidine phosphatase family protein [Umezawaea sp. Da 62-37]WNV86683.1 histidine phosphatase family protein [Umezawaea sp. Da 62-37]WNV86734.1 histidine phosphatase family protein [Umezawaea sp. Da 62-37]